MISLLAVDRICSGPAQSCMKTVRKRSREDEGRDKGEERLWWITAVLMLTAHFRNRTPRVCLSHMNPVSVIAAWCKITGSKQIFQIDFWWMGFCHHPDSLSFLCLSTFLSRHRRCLTMSSILSEREQKKNVFMFITRTRFPIYKTPLNTHRHTNTAKLSLTLSLLAPGCNIIASVLSLGGEMRTHLPSLQDWAVQIPRFTFIFLFFAFFVAWALISRKNPDTIIIIIFTRFLFESLLCSSFCTHSLMILLFTKRFLH